MDDIKLNEYIDFTCLKPITTESDRSKFMATATDRNYKSVCVYNSLIPYIKSYHPFVNVCTVVSFPHGSNHITSKVVETISAISLGADEVDVVANLSFIQEGNFDSLAREVSDILKAAHKAATIQNNNYVDNDSYIRHPLVLKFIIETGNFEEDVIRETATTIRDAYFKDRHEHDLVKECFVKTSTGHGPRGASLNDIMYIKEGIGDSSIGIKASGGIKSKDFALELIKEGATRIGTSTDLCEGF